MRNFYRIVLVTLLIWGSGCASMDKSEALYRSGEQGNAFEMAAGLLEDDAPKERLRAVQMVSKVGGDKAGALLLKRLIDPDQNVLHAVIRGLGKVNYEPAVPVLVDMIPAAKPATVEALADALRALGTPATDLLIKRFQSPSEKADRAAYKQVILQVGSVMTASIIQTLKGKSYFENRDTFDILIQFENPRVATLMIHHLNDEEVADQVVEGIVRLGHNAVTSVIQALKKHDPNSPSRVTEHLVRILGELRDRRASDTLIRFSQSASMDIRNAVDHSLSKIRGF